jgi:hypothetical protein
MVDALTAIKMLGYLLAGVALSAILHGILGSLRYGVWIVPALIACAIAISFLLEDHLRPYAWLIAGSMVCGLAIWSIP